MMIIIPPRSPESIRSEAEWLARQSPAVQRAYVLFYGFMAVATIALVLWGACVTFGA